jgi:hypothetical protein
MTAKWLRVETRRVTSGGAITGRIYTVAAPTRCDSCLIRLGMRRDDRPSRSDPQAMAQCGPRVAVLFDLDRPRPPVLDRIAKSVR